MRSIKLNFSTTFRNFGLERENLRKFNALLSERFGEDLTRAPRLTAVWATCIALSLIGSGFSVLCDWPE